MDQVRIGVIGVNGRGAMAKHWHQPDGRSIIVGGCDINPMFLSNFKNDLYPKAFITDDYRRLVKRKDIDAIAVMAPDNFHEEMAVAALEAGKHVFCEKPLSITTEGCDRILKAWKASGKHLMVGFNMRYMNFVRVMKEIVDSGAIGEIKAVWCRHFVGHGGDFFFHDWHADRANTTGLMLQKASHDLDVMHWVSGKYTKRVAAFGGLDYFGGDKPNDLECDDCPESETCVERNDVPTRKQCCYRREVNVEDNIVVIMEMEDGVKASYLQCQFSPDYHRNYTFIGTEGRIENNELEGKVYLYTRRSNTYRELADRVYDVKPAIGGHGGADPEITASFIDMIMDGIEPVASPEAGRMSVATGCAATESMRNGGIPVDIPPMPKL